MPVGQPGVSPGGSNWDEKPGKMRGFPTGRDACATALSRRYKTQSAVPPTAKPRPNRDQARTFPIQAPIAFSGRPVHSDA